MSKYLKYAPERLGGGGRKETDKGQQMGLLFMLKLYIFVRYWNDQYSLSYIQNHEFLCLSVSANQIAAQDILFT